ncbi:uncharacterized protein F5147DRAFT_727393, partial [Suillus discolor]
MVGWSMNRDIIYPKIKHSVLRIARSTTALMRMQKHSLVCHYVKIGWFSGWGLVGRYAHATIARSLAIATVTGLFAPILICATGWSPCCDRHYRCCQCNSKGEEEETHCLFE